MFVFAPLILFFCLIIIHVDSVIIMQIYKQVYFQKGEHVFVGIVGVWNCCRHTTLIPVKSPMHPSLRERHADDNRLFRERTKIINDKFSERQNTHNCIRRMQVRRKIQAGRKTRNSVTKFKQIMIFIYRQYSHKFCPMLRATCIPFVVSPHSQ